MTPIKRALISVSDKTGIVSFARQLLELGIDIISTGGTSLILKEEGILHRQIEEVTGLPSLFNGRVKTLHPKIHGGILGKRDKDAKEALLYQIDWIDLVVVNFYSFSGAVEDIDIGGPTLARAAAKNYAWTGVVIDPADYAEVIEEIRSSKELGLSRRKQLAEKAFSYTAHYDACIHQYFSAPPVSSGEKDKASNPLSPLSSLTLPLLSSPISLRYGENPHQKAVAFSFKDDPFSLLKAQQHQGKPLSYNNICDAEAALACILSKDNSPPLCAIVKHANPCGAAYAPTILEAFERAYSADSLSAFGGVVSLNRPCDEALAKKMTPLFFEVIIAPGYSEAALNVFKTKPNLRLLSLPFAAAGADSFPYELKGIRGGLLIQEKNNGGVSSTEWVCVTTRQPSEQDIENMGFAWQLVKQVKSNAIVLVKGAASIGIGGGQVSRIDAVALALKKAGQEIRGGVLASDAFFPFRDSIDLLANTGLHAIIQPGGSVRDEEVIAACNEQGIAMVFTGKRCFKH